jgi:hypothetical protein
VERAQLRLSGAAAFNLITPSALMSVTACVFLKVREIGQLCRAAASRALVNSDPDIVGVTPDTVVRAMTRR